MKPDLILASASPRRRELLQQIGVRFAVLAVDIPEEVGIDEAPEAYVSRLALEKAREGYRRSGASVPVLGSDTAVVCAGTIMGKPRDEVDAVRMLQRLAGREHQVITGVALYTAQRHQVRVVTTRVCFRPLSIAECHRYWATGEPCDKAGAYGIQGLGAVFVEAISGSYSAVVGLPLAETAAMLNNFDIPVWQTR